MKESTRIIIITLLIVAVARTKHTQAPQSPFPPSWTGWQPQPVKGWQGSWPLINILDKPPPWDLQLSLGGNWLGINGAPATLNFLEIDPHYVWDNHLGFGMTYSLVGIWDNDFFGRVFMNRWIQAYRVYGFVSWEDLNFTLGLGEVQYFGITAGNPSFSLVLFPEAGLEWKLWRGRKLGPGVLKAMLGPVWIISGENPRENPVLMGGFTFTIQW